MTWDEIIKIKNPNEALLAIDRKIDEKNLTVIEMIDMIEKYKKLHGVYIYKMGHYPNGEQVITPNKNR